MPVALSEDPFLPLSALWMCFLIENLAVGFVVSKALVLSQMRLCFNLVLKWGCLQSKYIFLLVHEDMTQVFESSSCEYQFL